MEAGLPGFGVLFDHFYSAEDVLGEIVLHVDVVSFESVHEIGDLNSWFHWRSTSLEIWSTNHSAL